MNEPNHKFDIFDTNSQSKQIQDIFKLNKVIRWELCTIISADGSQLLGIAIEWELLE